MRRYSVRPAIAAVALLGSLALLAAGCSSGPRGPGGPFAGWSPARRIPGTDAFLGAAGTAGTYQHYGSLWCASPENCTLVYPRYLSYTAPVTGWPVFSVSEVHGIWSAPREIPGLTSRYTVIDFSCTAPGDCIAAEPSGLRPAAILTEVHGAWGPPRPVPGLAALNAGGFSQISAVACGAAGWCVVAGNYWTPGTRYPLVGHNSQPFVASERGGAWQRAQPLPGYQELNRGWFAGISVISCGGGGTCTAGGTFRSPSNNLLQPFVTTMRNGVWNPAHAITGPSVAHGNGGIRAISCTTPGNCSAAGTYSLEPLSDPDRLFVATEKDGTWGPATTLPGPITVPLRSDEYPVAAISGLSCAAPGQCVIAVYKTANSQGEYAGVTAASPYLDEQVNGTWGAMHPIPGLAALSRSKLAEPASVSCSRPSDCSVSGYYAARGSQHAFLVTETAGTWGQAFPVPGLAPLGGRFTTADFVYCAPDGGCLGVGEYRPGSAFRHAGLFVTLRG